MNTEGSQFAKVSDRLPEGTEILEPADWFDDSLLGYSFSSSGGVHAVYSAESCVGVIQERLGLDETKASEYLAHKFNDLAGDALPVFVWGLDQVSAPKSVILRA